MWKDTTLKGTLLDNAYNRNYWKIFPTDLGNDWCKCSINEVKFCQILVKWLVINYWFFAIHLQISYIIQIMAIVFWSFNIDIYVMDATFQSCSMQAGLRLGWDAIFLILPNGPWFKNFGGKRWSRETKFILTMGIV